MGSSPVALELEGLQRARSVTGADGAGPRCRGSLRRPQVSRPGGSCPGGHRCRPRPGSPQYSPVRGGGSPGELYVCWTHCASGTKEEETFSPKEELSELLAASLHLHLQVTPGRGRELEACGHGLPEDYASDCDLVFLRVVFLLS